MDNLSSTAQAKLRNFIERIERLEVERKGMAADINDLYLEAKSQGFDPKIMKRVVAARKKGKEEREQEQALIDTYMAVFDTTPLGAYARRAANGSLELEQV